MSYGHMSNLQNVFKCTQQSNLKIQTDHCELLKKEVSYQRNFIIKDGVELNILSIQCVIFVFKTLTVTLNNIYF